MKFFIKRLQSSIYNEHSYEIFTGEGWTLVPTFAGAVQREAYSTVFSLTPSLPPYLLIPYFVVLICMGPGSTVAPHGAARQQIWFLFVCGLWYICVISVLRLSSLLWCDYCAWLAMIWFFVVMCGLCLCVLICDLCDAFCGNCLLLCMPVGFLLMSFSCLPIRYCDAPDIEGRRR
jgi:hypothetical protein